MICRFCGLAIEADDLFHVLTCNGQQGAVEAAANALGFGTPAAAPDFDGETYDPAIDHDRLGAQALRVWAVMRDGSWHTLAELEAATGDPQASISARLRDFRKGKFGRHTIIRQRREPTRGLWEYRLVQTDRAAHRDLDVQPEPVQRR